MNMEIRSDIPGTFYRSPGPGEPPFLQEGDVVAAGAVIGMVELMKQFCEVTSAHVGVLERFVVADGDTVDADAVIAVVKAS